MRAEGSSGPAGLWGSVCLLSEWLVLEALLDRGVFREKMGVLWASIRLELCFEARVSSRTGVEEPSIHSLYLSLCLLPSHPHPQKETIGSRQEGWWFVHLPSAGAAGRDKNSNCLHVTFPLMQNDLGGGERSSFVVFLTT